MASNSSSHHQKSEFGWCRLILYIISAILAAWIANVLVKPSFGLRDAIFALLLFLGLFLVFIWLSRFICGMFGGRAKADAEKGQKGHATQAAAGATAVAGASAAHAASQHDDHVEEVSRASSSGRDEQAQKAQAEKEAQAKAEAEKIAAEKAAAEKAAAEERAKAEAEAAKKAQAEKEVKAKADAKAEAQKSEAQKQAAPTAPAADVGVKPRNLKATAEGKPDNLKEIKGIGPKLEELCHQLGIFHFTQIAEWQADEVEWMDSNLEGFHGRVTRDDWVGQAKILAAGGETEFSKRVDDGKIY